MFWFGLARVHCTTGPNAISFHCVYSAVEALNKGHIGITSIVPGREVVLILEVNLHKEEANFVVLCTSVVPILEGHTFIKGSTICYRTWSLYYVPAVVLRVASREGCDKDGLPIELKGPPHLGEEGLVHAVVTSRIGIRDALEDAANALPKGLHVSAELLTRELKQEAIKVEGRANRKKLGKRWQRSERRLWMVGIARGEGRTHLVTLCSLESNVGGEEEGGGGREGGVRVGGKEGEGGTDGGEEGGKEGRA